MNHTISSLLRKPLLMNLSYGLAYQPLMKRYLSGALTNSDMVMLKKIRKRNAAYVVNSNSRNFNTDVQNAPMGSTLVIPVKGPIMKDDFCGDKGTASIMALLKQTLKMDNISNVILDIDSGGGSIDGTFELADYISQQFTKPIIAYVNGMCASAAYAIACACDEVIASHAAAEIGSIGVCVTINDWRESDKMNGLTEHYINATGSPDKNKEVMDARDGNYQTIREESLDPVLSILISTVKTNRPGASEETFTGKMYLAEKALSLGLIDSIKQLDDVVAMCEGEDDDEEDDYEDNSNPIFMFNKFPKLAALKGMAPDAITEEVLGHVNRELIEAGIEGVQLVAESDVQAQIDAAVTAAVEAANANNASLEDLTAQLTAAAEREAALQAEVQRLGQLVPEAQTTVVKGEADVTDKGTELSEADKYLQEQAKAELEKMNL